MTRALLLLAVVLGACVPPCDRVCTKARACDLSPRLSQAECEEACTRQEALYEIWEDEDKLQAFDDHKRCVMESTCGEIEDGACYDEDVFVF